MVTEVDESARKVDTKVANLLPKVAQKVANLKKPVSNQFKTGFQQVFKIFIFRLDIIASSKPVLNQF